MQTIEIRVPAVPVAQPRQRHAVRTFGGKATAVNYTPTKHPVTAFKATVRLAAQAAYQGPPFACPLKVAVDFVMPRPSSLLWKKRAMPRLWHTKAPDAENLAKSLLDALTGVAWVDDRQVCDLRARKYVASGDEAPHAFVRITPLEETA